MLIHSQAYSALHPKRIKTEENMTSENDDYTIFDISQITNFLFHPRPEYGDIVKREHWEEILIPVEDTINIGARFYPAEKKAPVLIFFHGNGEIVADYHDIAQLYQRMNVNFFPIDYRGYGKSTGTPTVSTTIHDASKTYDFVLKWLSDNGYIGAVTIMGRSLGSASALEIVDKYKDKIDGLIIESGFAFMVPLLRLLGIPVEQFGIEEDKGFRNFKKIQKADIPTLVIHAEHDHIIPFSDGQYLYDNCPDTGKELLMIPGANHNDIFARGMEDYMREVKKLIERTLLR